MCGTAISVWEWVVIQFFYNHILCYHNDELDWLADELLVWKSAL